jgi:hypothetical protein
MPTLDRDSRFDRWRRLLELSVSPVEQANRRIDRDFRVARRSDIVESADPVRIAAHRGAYCRFRPVKQEPHDGAA